MSDHNIICLWFPYLSVEITFKNEPEFKKKPFSTTVEYRKRQILYSINSVGESKGLKFGISLYDAHTLCETLKTKRRNHRKEISFLESQAKWRYQLTPRVSIEKENTLILDIKGCSHLFGGTANILKIINKNFKNIDITVFSSLGETSSIARLLVKFNLNKKILTDYDPTNNIYNITTENLEKNYFETPSVITNKKHSPFKIIPIEALNLTPVETAEMKYLGIETIDDLQSIPDKALSIRFGPQIIKNLKQIIGIDPELTAYLQPKKLFSKSIKLPEPINVAFDIKKLLEKLIISVCNHLKVEYKSTRILKLDFYETDNNKQSIKIQTSESTSDSTKFIELLNLKVPLVKLESGIDLIRVSANEIEPLFPVQKNLNLNVLKKSTPLQMILEKEEYKDLISRLGNRLGFDNLIHFHPNESHIPEKSFIKVSAAYCSPTLLWPISKFQRPTLIFKPEAIHIMEYKKIPKLFLWRGKKYNTIVSFGPERIAPEWWIDDFLWRTGLRDYWKIETTCGNRLWLFEAKGAEFKGGWFIHGTFI